MMNVKSNGWMVFLVRSTFGMKHKSDLPTSAIVFKLMLFASIVLIPLCWVSHAFNLFWKTDGSRDYELNGFFGFMFQMLLLVIAIHTIKAYDPAILEAMSLSDKLIMLVPTVLLGGLVFMVMLIVAVLFVALMMFVHEFAILPIGRMFISKKQTSKKQTITYEDGDDN